MKKDWLERHLEPVPAEGEKRPESISDEKLRLAIPEGLRENLAPNLEWQENGQVTWESENISCRFEYSGLSSSDLEVIVNHWKGSKVEKGVNLKIEEGKFRKLIYFKLEKVGSKPLDLSEFLENHTVFFTTDIEGYAYSGAKRSGGVIYVFEPFITATSILSLTHEIGHMVRDLETEDYVRFNQARTIMKKARPMSCFPAEALEFFKTAGKEVLESERGAWSHSLRSLRPFIGTPPFRKEDIDKAIRLDLLGYSNGIRDILERVEPE